ncbi:MAG: pyruvate kinase [Bacteroidales bacterium]|nr:pyruvate kinase [Bacteroidales bacterium]
MARKVKIVATLGPATDNPATINKLIRAGVNVFRLNFSYGSHESHRASCERIREAAEKQGKDVAIMQDICGPKIRIKGMKGTREIRKGDILYLSKKAHGDAFSITYPQLIDQLQTGDEIFFADGSVKVRVDSKDEETLVLKALTRGMLREGKGVNIPKSGIAMSALTEKDKSDLRFAAEIGIDLVAVSFVESREDVLEAKNILKANHSDAWVIAKIERKGALKNLDEILTEADGLMVARGDLGVESGLYTLPALQKEIIRKANEKALPVITATQMLTSMMHSPYPTRAEISDIANAVFDGSDAVMLSDETAVGEFPVEAVKVMAQTLQTTEKDFPYLKHFNKSKKGEAFAHAAAEISTTVKSKAIASISTSGATIRQISKFRPHKNIYAITFNQRLKNKLALVWGVEKTFLIDRDVSDTKLIYQFLKQIPNPKDRFIITMGSKTGIKGHTSMVRLIDQDERENIFNRFENEK